MATLSAIGSLLGEVQDPQGQLNSSHNEAAEDIYIGQYICDRLVQLGVTVRYAVVC